MAVSLEVSDGIAVIRIDEPSDTVLSDVRALLPGVADARAVVLFLGPRTGNSDIKQLIRASAAQREAQSARWRGVREELAKLPVPVVAAIGGSASGGAAELALACDLRVLAAEGGLGRATDDRDDGVPEGGGTEGGGAEGVGTEGRGAEGRGTGGGVIGGRVLVGRRVMADEALRLGLVDRVVPSSAVVKAAVELANECRSARAERKSRRTVAP